MPKTKAEKKVVAGAIGDRLDRMAGAVFADFSGVKINELEELRRTARAASCEYVVVKKTLFRRAAADRQVAIDVDRITGNLSILFGFADPVTPAKIAKTFAKAHPAMRVIGGVIREASLARELDVAAVTALGDLPSREELLARAVGSIAAPLRGMVGVLQGNLRKFVYVLNAIQQVKVN